MGINPGQTTGGRPYVGTRIEVRIPDDDLEKIDWIVSEAHKRYQRVPREMRRRTNVIRAVLRGGLDALFARVEARPEPEE